MATQGFEDAPEYFPDHPNLFRRLIRVIKGIMQGKTNNTGTFTLTANSTTTTVTFAEGRLGQNTVPTLIATTSNAAGALSGLYISSRSVANNTLTFTHANTAAVDKTFLYVLTG
jgi:hypothetical protein